MACSSVVSRLSSRLRPLSLKLNKSSLSSSSDVPLLKSTSRSHSSASATRISRSSSGAELFGVNDAVAQCNSFISIAVELVRRGKVLGINSSRHLNAFMTAYMQRLIPRQIFF